MKMALLIDIPATAEVVEVHDLLCRAALAGQGITITAATGEKVDVDLLAIGDKQVDGRWVEVARA